MKSDTQFMIGKLIEYDSDARRDAVHVAVMPVVAATYLSAGDHVGLQKDGRFGRLAQEIVGVVDPFLTTAVMPGDKFWLFLLPNTVDSLRHVWTHPSLPDEAAAGQPNNDVDYDDRYESCSC